MCLAPFEHQPLRPRLRLIMPHSSPLIRAVVSRRRRNQPPNVVRVLRVLIWRFLRARFSSVDAPAVAATVVSSHCCAASPQEVHVNATDDKPIRVLVCTRCHVPFFIKPGQPWKWIVRNFNGRPWPFCRSCWPVETDDARYAVRATLHVERAIHAGRN